MQNERVVPDCVKHATDTSIQILESQGFFNDTVATHKAARLVLDEFFLQRFVEGGEDEVNEDIPDQKATELLGAVEIYATVDEMVDDGLLVEIDDGRFGLTQKGKENLKEFKTATDESDE